ncbi:helveticin J family class III bacteriocin [Lactobacillus intestinalis]|uniref:helveticin J family class III bacteriocin n=1 Tax=Lactobacillus intestinalis TaxID=151781 RepID=UPI0024327948|nr:helveticin J family class III bacteriocin [Lactobacillus intestinalis]
MRHLNETTDISILSQFDMRTGYPAVVQKGNVGAKYVYGLQLRGATTTILRGYRGSNINTPILELAGEAGGHTQTWEYSGKKDNWFVGIKPSHNDPNYNWAKQIARVNICNTSRHHSSNLDFPRLAYLSYAGSAPYGGDSMTHAEAAVSSDYTKFLIATVEDKHIGHFTIYDLSKINNALDNAGTGYVSLENFPYENSFTVSNLYGMDQDSVINSIQGFDLDEKGNIYISSQLHPSLKKGIWTSHHKQLIKIPSYAQNDESQWESVNLSGFKGLDIPGYHSEVESIQIIGENHGYLTVAYHAKVDNENTTVLNRIYELSWN